MIAGQWSTLGRLRGRSSITHFGLFSTTLCEAMGTLTRRFSCWFCGGTRRQQCRDWVLAAVPLPSNSSSCRRWLWWSDCDLCVMLTSWPDVKRTMSSCVAQVDDVGQRAGCEVISGLSYCSCQTLDTHTLGPHDNHRRTAGRQSIACTISRTSLPSRTMDCRGGRLRLNSVSPSTIGSSAGC